MNIEFKKDTDVPERCVKVAGSSEIRVRDLEQHVLS